MPDHIILLIEKEAAKALALSPKTLRNWRVIGAGPPFVRIGRLIRYRASDVTQFIESGVRTSTSSKGGV